MTGQVRREGDATRGTFPSRFPARDRPPTAVLALAAAGLLAAAASRAGLAWDGAYYLFSTLHHQTPFVAHGRVLAALPQWPVVALSGITDNLVVLAVVFSLAYAALPLLALAAAWWVAAVTRPRLFVWAALGILLAMLPGQFFLVSEAVLAVQLGWPLLVWAAAGAPRQLLGLAVVLAAALFATHPFAAPLLVLVAALALWCGPRDPERVGLAAVLVAVAAVRLVAVGGSGYEYRSASLEVVGRHFGAAVAGLPLVALIAGVAAGAALIVAAPRRRRMLNRVAALATGVAGAALLAWASVPGRWSNALDYRTWALFAALPFVALLALDARRDPARTACAVGRRHVAVTAAAVFAVVLAVQSLLWTTSLSRFAAAVDAAAHACLATLDAVEHTPLRHWGRRSASLLVQGNAPTVVVLDAEDCAALRPGSPLPLAPFENTPRPGWLDLNAVGVTS